MDNLLERYVEYIIGSYPSKASYQSDRKINVRCPVCGDSKSNRTSKRGYFLLDRTPFLYYCHNAGCECCNGIPIRKFMQKFYPGFYDMYIKDLMKEKNLRKEINQNEQYRNVAVSLKVKQEVTTPTVTVSASSDIEDDFKNFVPIEEGTTSLFSEAISYCIKRKIPEHIWKKFYVSVSGKYKDRLVIPFYDDNDVPYFFQARAMNKNQQPKYLNKVGDKVPYNIFNVDKKKTIIALEGPIDSMFVENSIAMVGLKMEKSFLEWAKKNNVHFLLDNDSSGKKESLNLINNGFKVFNWKKFVKENGYKEAKDVNEFLLLNNLDSLRFSDLEDYFTNNTRSKMFFV